MKQDLMKGVIDMHVHTNPDLRLRAYDDFELMEAAIRVGARAIVIKTHQGTTMDRAYLCNRHNEIVHGNTNNFTMYGSITLNRVVPHFVLEQKLSGSRHSPQKITCRKWARI